MPRIKVAAKKNLNGLTAEPTNTTVTTNVVPALLSIETDQAASCGKKTGKS
jgi:hypothetical protein